MTVEKFSVFGDGKISASKDVLNDICCDLFELARYKENDPFCSKGVSKSYLDKATIIFDALNEVGYYQY